MGRSALIRSFIRTNHEICARIERRLPQAAVDLYQVYLDTVARYMNASSGDTLVVDVGGGRKCDFAKYRQRVHGLRIVAVDVSADELAQNHDVDETRVADVTRELPFADAEVDLVASHSVIEHLRSSEAFIAQSARVLKRGGVCVHNFPSKFAPFAIANQLLPHGLARRLLHSLIPGREGIQGFPAFYDRTYPSAARAMLQRYGFEVAQVEVSYYQAEYFDFFVPLYLLNALYEYVVYALGAENLAASLVIVGVKR